MIELATILFLPPPNPQRGSKSASSEDIWYKPLLKYRVFNPLLGVGVKTQYISLNTLNYLFNGRGSVSTD